MSETAAIHARLDRIEALLKQLLERPVAEVAHPNLTTDEEISLVLQQGIDPALYLKQRHEKRKREAQTR